jgi:hypothetical protein
MSPFWITIITAGITTVFTLICNIIYRRITKDKLMLHYILSESGLFPIDGGQGKFYNIKIKNNGNKIIEDINAEISFVNGKIKDVQLDKSIQLQKTLDQLSFNIKYLNPKAEIDCVITIGEGAQNSKPIIKISGKGATASDKTEKESKSTWGPILLSGEIGIIIGLFIYGYFLDPSSTSSVVSGKPDKIENVFSILNKAQLSHLFPQIINKNEDISYVRTAFYITHSYLKESGEAAKYITALKGLARIEDIAPDSKGTIYYLIYKINSRVKNNTEAKEYLQKCQTETPLIYQNFIEQDQYYNLDSLQNWLIKNNY